MVLKEINFDNNYYCHNRLLSNSEISIWMHALDASVLLSENVHAQNSN
jgi:hypothetical protein